MEVSGKGLNGFAIDVEAETEDEDEERESNGEKEDFRDKENQEEKRALAAELESSHALFEPQGVGVSTRAYQCISPKRAIGEEGKIHRAWLVPGLQTTHGVILQDQYWYSVLQLILFF